MLLRIGDEVPEIDEFDTGVFMKNIGMKERWEESTQQSLINTQRKERAIK